MNYWVILYRIAWGLLVILLVIGVTCVFLPQCNRLRELQRQRVSLEEQNRHTEALTRDLREKQEKFDSDTAFVVRTARETGLVMPNETVYKTTNAQSQAVAPNP